jgi:ABC-type dipeptide/oligopeptide/nickel transport system permease subunit
MWIFPSFFIIFAILCVNVLGDGLRDALDPRTGKHIG